MKNAYLLKMESADVHCDSEINDLILFFDKNTAINVKSVLNQFLESNSDIVNSSREEHHKIFYDNISFLVSLLSPYLDKEDASWLIREIGLNCYYNYMGIKMNAFSITEVKSINKKKEETL